MEKPIHDLIIGNLPGATTKEDPNWQRRGSKALAVITRAQHKRELKPIEPLKVTNIKAADVDVDKLKSTQKEDTSLDKLRVYATQQKNFQQETRRKTCISYRMMSYTGFSLSKKGRQQ